MFKGKPAVGLSSTYRHLICSVFAFYEETQTCLCCVLENACFCDIQIKCRDHRVVMSSRIITLLVEANSTRQTASKNITRWFTVVKFRASTIAKFQLVYWFIPVIPCMSMSSKASVPNLHPTNWSYFTVDHVQMPAGDKVFPI